MPLSPRILLPDLSLLSARREAKRMQRAGIKSTQVNNLQTLILTLKFWIALQETLLTGGILESQRIARFDDIENMAERLAVIKIAGC